MDQEVDKRKILVLFAKKILISIQIQNAKVNSNHQQTVDAFLV
jgi:hypothetical protein